MRINPKNQNKIYTGQTLRIYIAVRHSNGTILFGLKTQGGYNVASSKNKEDLIAFAKSKRCVCRDEAWFK